MKNVVITGSSNGFGYLSALTLARKGYKVWATMRLPESKNAAKKESLLSTAQKENLNLSVLELDVTQDKSVQKAIDQIIREDGRVDNLVNNAGVMFIGITEAYSLEQAKEQFDINLFGVMRCTKAVLPHMRKARRGLIINVSSIAGRLTFPYFGVYCASKHALEAYSQALVYELAPFGIEVSIVEPGPFGTGLLRSGPQEADREVFEAYDGHKEAPEGIMSYFDQFFQSENAVDPQVVVDEITRLIEAERGKRPVRVVSGIDFGTTELNDRIAPIQEATVKEGLQMGHLLELAP